MKIRNRIKGHRRVRASELVPHEMNPRTHTDTQREALRELYREIGFARSVLAYELPDGRLKLIDGHLRQSLDPDQEIDVEVLDVNDEEARKLLLSIDPLAQLAGYDTEAVDRLRATVATDSQTLEALWQAVSHNQALSDAALKKSKSGARQQNAEEETRFLVLIECENERQQVDLLRRFKREGLVCQAKTT